MECFRNCTLDDLGELQKISQITYVEAFYDLLDNEDVKGFYAIFERKGRDWQNGVSFIIDEKGAAIRLGGNGCIKGGSHMADLCSVPEAASG